MNRSRVGLSVLATLLPLLPCSAAETTPDDLERRAAAIRPTDAETRWQQIPWLRSVIEGQQTARRENRPIMYWHVDDDPLERC